MNKKYKVNFFANNQLEKITEEIRAITPNIGQQRLQGALRSRGIRVQRWRIRKILREVDPLGTVPRRRSMIHKRKYSVPTPNALWHIDGNH